jgi:predicted dehydrogenase
MKRRRLRLGLLGTGVAAWRLYKPAFTVLGEHLELVACANRTRSKAVRYAKFAGFSRVEDSTDSLFHSADIDAIFISLPIEVQPHFVLEALRAGKAVLSEKPVAGSLSEAKSLIRRANALASPWMVGENFAFMSHVRKLEALVKAGKFGQIRLVEARQMNWVDHKNPYFHTEWRAAPKHIGGFVLDAGVHLAHIVNRCFGAPRVIKARQGSFAPSLPPIDTAIALLEFESGALGTWTSCFTARDAGAPLVRVLGERATACLYYDRLEVVASSGKVRRFTSVADSFAAQLEHFADVVLRRTPMDVTPAAALDDLRLITKVCGG